NGYVALEAFNMPMQVTAITHRRTPVFTSIISQVTPSESSVIKKVAYEPLFAAHRGVARAARRRDPAVELRQDRHRGERGYRSVEHGRGAVVARLSHQSGR